MAGLLDDEIRDAAIGASIGMAPGSLPNLGNKIDYRTFGELQDRLKAMQPHIDNLRSNIDAVQRIRSGQIGPEIEQLLASNNILRKPIQKGLLDLDVNYMNPYIGFTYRF